MIEAAGLTLGDIGTDPVGQVFDDSWVIHAQLPSPNEQWPPGTAVRLTVKDPSQACP
jgi:hypothetical protein